MEQRAGAWWRGFTRIGVRYGLGPRHLVALEVPDSGSGLTRRVTLAQIRGGRSRFLIAPSGDAGWAADVYTAGGRVVIRRWSRWPATLVEVPVALRAPVIRAYLRRRRWTAGAVSRAREARGRFGVSGRATLAEIAAVAGQHPVFWVQPGPSWSNHHLPRRHRCRCRSGPSHRVQAALQATRRALRRGGFRPRPAPSLCPALR